MGKTVECIERAIRSAHGIEVPSADALGFLRDRAVVIAQRVMKDRKNGREPAAADLEVLIQTRRELTLAYRPVPLVIDEAVI